MSQIVELEDGVLIEVESQHGFQPMSGDGKRQKLKSALKDMKPFLTNLAGEFRECMDGMKETARIDQVAVELGVSFEAEGSLFIAKGKTGANLSVTFTLKADDKNV